MSIARMRALAAHLDCSTDEIQPAPYGARTFSAPGRSEYLVLSAREAEKAAHEAVADSLWAFRPEFLAGQCDLPTEVFKAIADNRKCEDNNGPIRKLVDKCCAQGFYGFARAAIEADGRGQFLAHYDSAEHEITRGGRTFYIYRVN